MGYTQRNNPLPRKSSPLNFGPRGMQKILDTARGLHNKMAADPRVDLSFNPKQRGASTFLKDERGGYLVDKNTMQPTHQDYEGQYGGMISFGSSQRPALGEVKNWRSGDVYVENDYLNRTLSFDPEKGYSARPLDIYYEKSDEPVVDEHGYEKYTTPYSGFATIGNIGAGMYTDRVNIAPGLDLAKGRKFDLSNTKDREEFERYRNQMYENQQNMLQYANAMYALGEEGKYRKDYDLEDGLGGYHDDSTYYDIVDPISGKTRNQQHNEEMYKRQFMSADPLFQGVIGAPGSDERAATLAYIDRIRAYND